MKCSKSKNEINFICIYCSNSMCNENPLKCECFRPMNILFFFGIRNEFLFGQRQRKFSAFLWINSISWKFQINRQSRPIFEHGKMYSANALSQVNWSTQVCFREDERRNSSMFWKKRIPNQGNSTQKPSVFKFQENNILARKKNKRKHCRCC